MKLTSIVGTGSGKMGGSVFSVRAGEQIVRSYQPNVANPQSALQVAQRAKIKLAAQFASAMAQELYPYGRMGSRSSRNLFVSDLFSRGAITYADNQANIVMTDVRLTKSHVEMMTIATPVRVEGAITISGSVLPSYVGKVLGAKVVVVATNSQDNEPYILRSDALTISSEGAISGSVNLGTNAAVSAYIYAYMPASEAFHVKYGDIEMNEATAVLLEVESRNNASDFVFSITQAFAIPAGA